MESVLLSAVVVVGALGLLNLLLLLAMLRRLREYEAKWARAGLDKIVAHKTPPQSGSRVAEFAAMSTDGHDVSLQSLPGPFLAGFFSAQCPACRAELPRFVQHIQGLPSGRDRNLVVVAGPAEMGADIIQAVRHLARVVVEPEQGPVATAFGVRGSPTFVQVDKDGTVRSSGTSMRELLGLVSTPA